MPRYFFHLFENGHCDEDDVGLEFDTSDQIRDEAMRILPDILREELSLDGDRQAFTVLVVNALGLPVYTATVNFAGVWLDNLGAPLLGVRGEPA